MSDQDQEFQQRWEFRRNQYDLDSSSDDQSGPNVAQDPKLKKHKLVSNFSSGEDNKETNDNTNADPRSDGKLSSEETNKEPNPPRKNLQSKGKGKMQKPKRLISLDQDNPFDAGLNDLRGYSELLVEGIKVARKGMLDWMSEEIEKSNQNHTVPSKPNVKPTRNNPAKSKRKSGKGKTTSDPAGDQVTETPMKTKGSPAIATPSPSAEKKKRKRVSLSEKKQPKKTGEADQKSNDVVVPVTSVSVTQAPNYLTLPTVLEHGTDRGFIERNKMNSTISPRNQQKDGDNVDDHYEQSRGLGNGNRNGFPFPFTCGMNGRIGIPNTNQFGLQFVNQENRMNYGHLDQHLRFQLQSGVMDLQSYTDMRRANFQPR